MSAEVLNQLTEEKINAEQAVVNEAEQIVADAAVKGTEQEALSPNELSHLDSLDEAILNGPRLTHLRKIYQSALASGRTEEQAMADATESLMNSHETASALPGANASAKLVENADKIFQQAEDIMRMPDDKFNNYLKGFNNPEDSSAYIRSYDSVDQKVYSNGAKHIYAVETDGKKKHISHDEILEAYGYGSRKAEETEIAKDEALIAAGVAKATPQMVKTAKAMMNPQAKEQQKADGVYGYKADELVNHGQDIITKPFTKDFELVTDRLEGGYAGPVQPGMEIELAPSAEVAAYHGSDNLPVLTGEAGDTLPVLASDTSENAITDQDIDAAVDAQGKLKLRDRLRNRLNDLRVRGQLLAQGDVRGALGDNEGKLANKKRVLGAAVVVGAGVLVWLNHKNNWGIDINPLDGDGLDLNPSNNSPEQVSTVAPDASEVPEVSPLPEMVSVQVDPGEGTSHIARDTLGINFDSVEQWDRFNAATNPLFENLDGAYQDATSGEWRIANAGNFQVPQSVLDEMQRVAEQIRTSS